jgi:membrane-bound lytic murein transglycosylase F
LKFALALLTTLLLTTCSRAPTVLDQVLRAGELRVVTRNLPSSYYMGSAGPQGPEFDLATKLATELGVRLYIYSVPSVNDVLREMREGRAHIAAAGLTLGQPLPPGASYGLPYQQVKEHLIYRMGATKPLTLIDAAKGHIEVSAGSAHAGLLREMRTLNPDLAWVENPRAESEDLLYRISRRDIDYTIVDSNEFAISRAFHPEIRIAFNMNAGKQLAWAIDARDPSLLQRVNAFFVATEAEGRLASILDKYYSDTERFDFIQARQFKEHVATRLPLYRDWFKEAAAEVGVDWRLLAAIGYQESKWDPNAISPTGVRGLMMLTEDTARILGVQDRLNARESIFGGARYFVQIRNRMPKRIPEPDRSWLALAAYNVGLGHLEDARRITQLRGKDADQWLIVRDQLPLLTDVEWYSRVKNGYARGWEPVRFVDNIRNYLDVLTWVASDSGRPAEREPEREPLTASTAER